MDIKLLLYTHGHNLYSKLDQSEEFDVIGQQVSYCRPPRALEQHNARVLGNKLPYYKRVTNFSEF